jgi:hypothetical protein
MYYQTDTSYAGRSGDWRGLAGVPPAMREQVREALNGLDDRTRSILRGFDARVGFVDASNPDLRGMLERSGQIAGDRNAASRTLTVVGVDGKIDAQALTAHANRLAAEMPQMADWAAVKNKAKADATPILQKMQNSGNPADQKALDNLLSDSPRGAGRHWKEMNVALARHGVPSEQRGYIAQALHVADGRQGDAVNLPAVREALTKSQREHESLYENMARTEVDPGRHFATEMRRRIDDRLLATAADGTARETKREIPGAVPTAVDWDRPEAYWRSPDRQNIVGQAEPLHVVCHDGSAVIDYGNRMTILPNTQGELGQAAAMARDVYASREARAILDGQAQQDAFEWVGERAREPKAGEALMKAVGEPHATYANQAGLTVAIGGEKRDGVLVVDRDRLSVADLRQQIEQHASAWMDQAPGRDTIAAANDLRQQCADAADQLESERRNVGAALQNDPGPLLTRADRASLGAVADQCSETEDMLSDPPTAADARAALDAVPTQIESLRSATARIRQAHEAAARDPYSEDRSNYAEILRVYDAVARNAQPVENGGTLSQDVCDCADTLRRASEDPALGMPEENLRALDTVGAWTEANGFDQAARVEQIRTQTQKKESALTL